jgi:hypothetical protein
LGEEKMRLTEKYVYAYALAILLSGLLLIGIGVQQIEIYYAVYLIEFLVATELAASFRKSLERNLRPIILVFLAGFLYTVIERIIQILI